jgi:predicted transposase/invertase (TIGR01784 family)
MLAEHQSSAVWNMPVRMVEYQLSIINNHLKANKNQTSLTIVVTLLFYHGTQSPYPFSLDILELFNDYNLAAQTFARPAKLIDLTVIPDKVIKQHHHISMLEYNQKHIRDPEFTLDHTRNLVYIINKMINHASPEQLDVHGNIRNRITKHLHYTQYFANITDEKQFRQEIENIDYIKKENIMGPIPRKYIQQGKVAARIEVAKSMLNENLDIKLIIKLTGLPEEELAKLTTSK